MTREELIQIICNSNLPVTCPEYQCPMPEEEGNTGECCLKCAEKQLAEYEKKIKADVIEEYFQYLEKRGMSLIEGDNLTEDFVLGVSIILGIAKVATNEEERINYGKAKIKKDCRN